MKTVIQLLNETIDQVRVEKSSADGIVAREFALVITAIEDAKMRFNRGMAFKSGHYSEADIQARLIEEANDVLLEAENAVHPDQLSFLESQDELGSAA